MEGYDGDDWWVLKPEGMTPQQLAASQYRVVVDLQKVSATPLRSAESALWQTATTVAGFPLFHRAHVSGLSHGLNLQLPGGRQCGLLLSMLRCGRCCETYHFLVVCIHAVYTHAGPCCFEGGMSCPMLHAARIGL